MRIHEFSSLTENLICLILQIWPSLGNITVQGRIYIVAIVADRLLCFMVKGQKGYEKTNKQKKEKNTTKYLEPQVEANAVTKGHCAVSSSQKMVSSISPVCLASKPRWSSSPLTCYHASLHKMGRSHKPSKTRGWFILYVHWYISRVCIVHIIQQLQTQ